MMNTKLRVVAVVAYILFSIASVFAQPPKVTKVEPPNWWAGLPESPMVLLYGTNLAKAKVTVNYSGLTIAKVEPGNEGYLFVWLKIAPTIKAGTAKFVVSNGIEKTGFDFPVMKRERSDCPGAECKFAGLGQDDVMYVIMPDRFANGDPRNDDPATAAGFYDRKKPRTYHGGDLKGVQDHLPYIKDLGATALWLTPFWKNDSHSADYHGYHVTDFYGVDEHFGTVKDFEALVAAAHAQGIKLFFDYVVNHIGPYHVWAEHPPLPTWLHGTVKVHRPFESKFQYMVDPHAPPQEWRDIVEGWFPTAPPANALPDLNVEDPHVAKYLLDNAVWWMEMGGLDGMRLDTFPYSSRKFWGEWHRELFRIYPKASTIGEIWNFDPTITSFFEGGRKEFDGIDSGLPTMFDFPLFNTMRDVLVRNAPASKLQETLRFDGLYQRPYGLVTFLGNHDTMRFMGEQGMTVRKMKAAFGLLMTLRGIPSIYYGDEIAMPGQGDPDNRQDFPGGWTGDAQNAFQASGRTTEQQEVFAYVKSLTGLRKQSPALRYGRQWTIGAGDNYFAYLREDGHEKLLTVFSKSTGDVSLAVNDTPLESAQGLEPLLGAPAAVMEAGTIKIPMQDFSVAIYRVR